MEIQNVKQLKNILNKYPDDAKVFIYDAEKGTVHPIVECSPFNTDDPKVKEKEKENDNFITIDYE